MFAEAIEAILKDECTPKVVREIEAGGSPERLWQALEDGGFLELLRDETAGGAGLPLAELYVILNTFGRYLVPIPAAQTIVARALLPDPDVPPGMITFAATLSHSEDGGMTCRLTPYGAVADHVLACDGDDLLLLSCAHAVRGDTGVRHSLTANLSWPADYSPRRFEGQGAALAYCGAALQAAMLSGAMAHVCELTLRYCNDRVQFGKSLSKFQAIQHQLSIMAEHAVAAAIAAEAAFDTDGPLPLRFAAAVAKARTSEAAVLIASIGHAMHGAIGVTEEYDLQLWTRRLHEWRAAHGSETYWNNVVGREVLASDRSILDIVREP